MPRNLYNPNDGVLGRENDGGSYIDLLENEAAEVRRAAREARSVVTPAPPSTGIQATHEETLIKNYYRGPRDDRTPPFTGVVEAPVIATIPDYEAVDSVAIVTTSGSTTGVPNTVVVSDTISVAARATYEGGAVGPVLTTDSSVTWESSATGVATVSGGVITGVSAGTTQITAEIGGVESANHTVTVTAD